jgi:hypothetical protein
MELKKKSIKKRHKKWHELARLTHQTYDLGYEIGITSKKKKSKSTRVNLSNLRPGPWDWDKLIERKLNQAIKYSSQSILKLNDEIEKKINL